MDNLENALHRLAYTVGFFLGDGCLTSYPFKSSRNGKTYHKNDVAFGKPDREVIERVQRQIADVFGKEYAISERRLRSGLPYFELRAHRRDIFEFFAVNTAMKSQIPAPYFRAPDEVKRDLLSGLFDADGHVSEFKDQDRKRWQMGFSNMNFRLVADIASILQKMNVRVGKISEAHKAGYAVTYIIHPNMRDWHERGFKFYSQRREEKFSRYLDHVLASETRYAEAVTPA